MEKVQRWRATLKQEIDWLLTSESKSNGFSMIVISRICGIVGLAAKRVLLVLDDVDQREQLETLAREQDWIGEGSRIIITCRAESFEHGVGSVYRLKELNMNDAVKLFSWYAFKKHCLGGGYEVLAYTPVNNAKGIPLAPKFLGSKLHGRSISQWRSELN
ncbi:disease resistance protein RUN1-like [Mangifera indica]|uniref:disease resistance protein RUN1-like n=1 Tax=Mangifera indica TaxID=29780 RepID=UPI001CFB3A29|nr:disease resistance protein RUN1-like [Mangifera indica]